ncbi:ACT domain-containing protein [Erythrobacter sp. HKB08]|uniref:ACT domain-containing protein n=1 Tax=Erythrobacter sp. HKB08 TaxID=2502843 RepID=UPI00100876FD|nr:ACT domain-containing protein [Erythrobacter sp. HKB08]
MAGGGERVSDTAAMIAGMSPALDPERWCFVTVTPEQAPRLLGSAIGTFREAEGVSAIVPAEMTDGADPVFRRITLQVLSDLEGHGLTAAVASALSEAGIACNMVAAYHHDHAFVPEARADEALAILQALAASHS